MVDLLVELWPIITAIVGLIAAAGAHQYKMKDLSKKDSDKEHRIRELEIGQAETRVGIRHIIAGLEKVDEKVDRILEQ